MEPGTPADSASLAASAPRHPGFAHSPPSRIPPAASLRAGLPALSSLVRHPRPASTPPRSLPTPPGIRVSSPDRLNVPGNPASRPLSTSPGLPSGTSVSRSLRTGPPRISPTSILHASNNLAPTPLPRCIVPRTHPSVPVAGSRPAHRPAHSIPAHLLSTRPKLIGSGYESNRRISRILARPVEIDYPFHTFGL